MEPEQVALGNHLILSNVFKHCGTRDLQSHRLVSKAWDDVSLAQLRQTVPLIVRQDEEVPAENYVARLLSEAPAGTAYIKRSLAQVLEYLESLSETDHKRIRYSTVVLQGWDLVSPSHGQEQFLRACGQGIEELHLIQCQLDQNSFHDVVLACAPNVKRLTIDDRRFKIFNKDILPGGARVHPNIKSLTILSRDPYGAIDPTEAVIFWFRYLRGFPDLEVCMSTGHITRIMWNRMGQALLLKKKVVLSYPVMAENEERDWITENRRSLAAVLMGMGVWKAPPCALPDMPKIKHLDIARLDWPAVKSCPSDRRECLQNKQIGMPPFPLKTLKIDIGCYEEAERISVPELLGTFVATLETLVVTRLHIPDISPVNSREPVFGFLETMTKLQTLELIGNVTFNLDFLRFTPNLRNLRITPMHRTKYFADLLLFSSRIAEPLHRRHPQFMNLVLAAEHSNSDMVLQNLTELELGYQLEGPQSVALLGKWMPNVETLKIPVTPEIFTEICRQWGNSLQKLELQNLSVITDGVITGIRSGASVASLQPNPNVTWLKNLKSFTMEHPHYHLPFECDHQIPCISERSILQGFAKMERLQNLTIFVAEEMGEECMQTLETMKQRLQVATEICFNCKCNR